jgi:nitrogen fixation/metabolism regulation signal transduction histidine kinase
MRLASLGETESVRLGDGSGDFFESISGSFNSMVEEIENQHRKLVEAEKVRAWRDIARKMAHEIKNPLTPIRISAENLVKSYDKRKDNFREILVEKAEIISEEAYRIRQVIDEFVEFARLPVIKPRTQDMNALILAIISLYENYDNLEIKTNLHDIEPFAFDDSQISRALHNLIKNSVESFEGKPGVILIETGRVSLYNRTFAEIVISDNGPGMPEEIREKVFTPYFTTKPGGTGLGLLICYNIVLGHNGTIEIDSRPGEGTVTTIRIPIKRERGDEEDSN